MNTQERIEAISQMILNAKEMNAFFESRLEASKSVLRGQGYIVQPHDLPGFAIAFDTKRVQGGFEVTNPQVCGLYKGSYSMFTKEDAIKIAANNFNGRGETASAVHINDAWLAAIAANKETIAQMEALLATIH